VLIKLGWVPAQKGKDAVDQINRLRLRRG
jgi:hypothetical protein